jgi:hypothetical protein
MMDWNTLTPLEQAQCLYSDLYKDVYGFRPSLEGLTLLDLDRKIQALDCAILDMKRDEEEDADPEAWKKYV